MAENLRALANERMTIVRALNLAGSDIGDFTVGSIKMYCPFGGIYHADGGYTKAMRVYPATNTANCFAGCGFFTPVRVIAKIKDMSEVEAAEWILAETGYVEPDYRAQWDALVGAGEEIDRDGLSEALKVACARMSPEWEERQFDTDVATRFSKCLSLLPRVKTQEEARLWLSTTKQAMAQVLKK